jgi:hypothetical protein
VVCFPPLFFVVESLQVFKSIPYTIATWAQESTSKDGGKVPDNLSTMVCEKCSGGHCEDKIILCDRCDKGWHMFCVSPPLDNVPDGEWVCPTCNNLGRSLVYLHSALTIITKRLCGSCCPCCACVGGRTARKYKIFRAPLSTGIQGPWPIKNDWTSRIWAVSIYTFV